MKNQLLHTPEGVRDIYNGECARKQALEKRMLDKLHSYGYRDIETPAFEFFDVFGKEVGTVPSKDLYKFFDREGHTLVLRPDITPSIARAASKYYSEEDLPVRLCYKGNTFINNSSYQGRLKETTQIGAEFIGDNSAQADAEAVALVTEVLLAAGLTEFQVSLGHVEFFRSICRRRALTGKWRRSFGSSSPTKIFSAWRSFWTTRTWIRGRKSCFPGCLRCSEASMC